MGWRILTLLPLVSASAGTSGTPGADLNYSKSTEAPKATTMKDLVAKLNALSKKPGDRTERNRILTLIAKAMTKSKKASAKRKKALAKAKSASKTGTKA